MLNQNMGLNILRSIMCFMVILLHFCSSDIEYGFISYFKEYAVPVFMFMSFYFTEKLISSREFSRYKRRIKRLLIPHILWALIYWIAYKVIDIFYHTDLENGIKDLVWQIFTGHSINATMWYQVDLIVLTLIFVFTTVLFSPSKRHLILVGGGIAAIFLQYSGINKALFENCSYEIMYPAGRLVEMVPYAVLGYYFSYYNLLEKLKVKWLQNATLAFIGIIFIREFTIFAPKPSGYMYSGIEAICVAILWVIIFYICPFEKIPEGALRIVHLCTKYTLGIYCMHRLIGNILNIVWGINVNTIGGCALIYLCSYVFGMLISKMGRGKWKKIVE